MCVCVCRNSITSTRHLKPALLPKGNVAGSPRTENQGIAQIQHKKAENVGPNIPRKPCPNQPSIQKGGHRKTNRTRKAKKRKSTSPNSTETGKKNTPIMSHHEPAKSRYQVQPNHHGLEVRSKLKTKAQRQTEVHSKD